jgi:hypothetical protein
MYFREARHTHEERLALFGELLSFLLAVDVLTTLSDSRPETRMCSAIPKNA